MRSWPWFAVGTYVKFTILVAFPVLFNFLVTSSLAECKTCANDSIKLIYREFIAECLPVLLRTVKGLSIKEWWNDKRSLFAWCVLSCLINIMSLLEHKFHACYWWILWLQIQCFSSLTFSVCASVTIQTQSFVIPRSPACLRIYVKYFAVHFSYLQIKTQTLIS